METEFKIIDRNGSVVVIRTYTDDLGFVYRIMEWDDNGLEDYYIRS